MQVLKRIAGGAALLIVLAALSFLLPGRVQPVVYRIVMLAGIAIVMAVSLNLINGFTGQFSIGHAGFQAVGAYVAAALTVYGHNRLFAYLPKSGTMPIIKTGLLAGAPTVESFFLSMPVVLSAILVGGLVSALIGYLVGLPSLRLRGDYLAIVTLGFGEIIRVSVQNLDVVGGPRGFQGNVETETYVPGVANFFWVYLTVAAVILVSRNLRFSTFGLTFLSVREDEIAAQAMGINTTRVKVQAFVLGAFFAGAAGALYALFEQGISDPTSFGFVRSFDFVTMVVLGGLGSITGATLAAVLLTALPEVLRSTLGADFNQYRLLAYALLLIILMLVRPQGIFGPNELRLRKFWRNDKDTPTPPPATPMSGSGNSIGGGGGEAV